MADQLPATTHTCPAPPCAARVRRDQFACPRDWVRLPAELRRPIVDGYRRNWPMWVKAANTAIAWYGEHHAEVADA